MSPNPGEPGHETGGWTHAICNGCYSQRYGSMNWSPNPHRVVDDSGTCCYCGSPAQGIYVRADPSQVHAA